MDYEKIKYFVCNHAERVMNAKMLKRYPLAILFFAFFIGFFSLFLEQGMAGFLVILGLLMPYWTLVIALDKKAFVNRLLLQGLSGLMLAAVFLMLSFSLAGLLENGAAYKGGIVLCLIFGMVIYALLRLARIKRIDTSKPIIKDSRDWTAGYAGIAALGPGLARVMFGGKSQESMITFVVLAFAALEIIFLAGVFDTLLKYYFCRKYKLDAEPEE